MPVEIDVNKLEYNELDRVCDLATQSIANHIVTITEIASRGESHQDPNEIAQMANAVEYVRLLEYQGKDDDMLRDIIREAQKFPLRLEKMELTNNFPRLY